MSGVALNPKPQTLNPKWCTSCCEELSRVAVEEEAFLDACKHSKSWGNSFQSAWVLAGYNFTCFVIITPSIRIKDDHFHSIGPTGNQGRSRKP